MSFQPILDVASADYAKQTGIDLVNHPSSDRLQACHSPDDVLKLLEEKANEFNDYREGNRKLIDCLKPVVTVIHALSGVLGEAVSSVSPNPHPSCSHFHQPAATRFRSNQQRRSSLAWIFSLQYVSPGILQPRGLTISGCYRQPAVSARATMRSLTCSTASEISSNAFESIPISR